MLEKTYFHSPRGVLTPSKIRLDSGLVFFLWTIRRFIVRSLYLMLWFSLKNTRRYVNQCFARREMSWIVCFLKQGQTSQFSHLRMVLHPLCTLPCLYESTELDLKKNSEAPATVTYGKNHDVFNFIRKIRKVFIVKVINISLLECSHFHCQQAPPQKILVLFAKVAVAVHYLS